MVNRRWVWLESMGVASGCGCKEVYRFPHITYPYSSCICSFLFVHFLNVFHSCVIIYIYWEDYAQQYGKCRARSGSPQLYLLKQNKVSP